MTDKFDQDAVLALINAVYLKNKFQHPLETPYSEWTMDFTAENGVVSQPVGMSNGTRSEEYIYSENGQGLVLPYDDGRLALLLMLPDEDLTLTEYLAAWDGDTVKALLDSRRSEKVNLTMPKFKTEWSGSLVPALAGMGLSDAFDPRTADFTFMGAMSDGDPLYVGDVIHKTAFEVNEEGTEAAAITAVIVFEATSIAPVEEPVYLRLDRPFVYGIVDLENGLPLFLGTVENL